MKKVHWLGLLGAVAAGGATGVAEALLSGETDTKKAGAHGLGAAIIAAVGWIFPTYKRQKTGATE